MNRRLLLLPALLAACSSAAPDQYTGTEDEIEDVGGKADRTGGEPLSSFYTIAPSAGGWTASLVGKTTAAPLEVSALELGTLSLDGEDSARLIVRGEVDASGKLVVSEAWRSATAAAPSGTIWQLRAVGVRCRAGVPCFDVHAAKLNST